MEFKTDFWKIEILQAYQQLIAQQKLSVRVVVNPAIAAYEDWKSAARENPYFKIRVSRWIDPVLYG